ncbi:MAG: ribosome-binding factor A [Planctomycetes bacterium]|nr:ribosome-binding factor A [Planctomycetota bacterium]
MAARRFSCKPPSDLCTQLSAEDGVDPRYASRDAPIRVANRKALQLCRQVERTLSVCLEGRVLRDLTVHSVAPAPDTRRLLVRFLYHGTEPIATALAALTGFYPRLRAEIARAIHRRKTPELVFEIVAGS